MLFASRSYTQMLTVPQVTTVQGDAADEPTISGICERALKEEGRLDVFFANVSTTTRRIAMWNLTTSSLSLHAADYIPGTNQHSVVISVWLAAHTIAQFAETMCTILLTSDRSCSA